MSKKNTSYRKDVTKYQVVMRNDFATAEVLLPRGRLTEGLMFYAIAHIHNGSIGEDSDDGDTELKTVSFWWEDFGSMSGANKRACERAIKQGAGAQIRVLDEDLGTIQEAEIFDICNWDAGYITLRISKDLSKYLLNLIKQFVTIPVERLLGIKDPHVRALVLYLSKQHNSARHRKDVCIGDLAKICKLPKSKYKYSVVSAVLRECSDEHRTTGFAVKYDKDYRVLSWERYKRKDEEC